ncbi:unnamed protein product [Meloidogyne enterolobii]|uniref:Uncharacterized protein n=1 Tax=Meloidogyne enterolobii TaxID=390850 RepID=A0ACB1AVF2_MELEN
MFFFKLIYPATVYNTRHTIWRLWILPSDQPHFPRRLQSESIASKTRRFCTRTRQSKRSSRLYFYKLSPIIFTVALYSTDLLGIST